ncbi:uncharacterized protein LOC130768894 [Actinidia eriantha]|uniref:uncharacterized protein LOC130768894 n=1 Tax=Actinidia eriantha TaxID=165200 RepID=UPI00258B76CF|nr:uncharacterized protein LOC130768894 [Actinidia eriantha]
MGIFMAQVMELLEKLNKKADIAATRLLFLKQKVRELKKEIKLLKLGKGKMEEEQEEEEEVEDEVREEEEERTEVNKEESREGEKEGEKEAEQEKDGEEDDSSAIESDVPSPISGQKLGQKYGLRQREGKKFSNTMDTPLVLTPSPPASP